MIGSLSIAMTQGIGIGTIANCIHPYPTQGEGVRKVGDMYQKNPPHAVDRSYYENRHWLAAISRRERCPL